ncbi:hypothetical protein LCM17_13075 [Cereibacter sphaeroides]|nr:hypothetical protein [Cereibacter sphaeroides]
MSATDIPGAVARLQLAVLKALPREEWCFPLGRVAGETGIPREVCRGLIAELRADGLVVYQKGLLDDAGDAAGSGYRLSQRGVSFLAEARHGQ